MDDFPYEKLFVVIERPWFIDMDNFKPIYQKPRYLTLKQRQTKLYHDVDFYLCDGPYLVKIGHDGLIMRCVDDKETISITWHYPHSSAYGRHHNEEMTITKFCKVVFGGQPN